MRQSRPLPAALFAGRGLEPVRRLEFHIVYRCVNACVFCSEREHMRRFAAWPASTEEIAAVLRRRREAGFDHVTFTGGEPTLYPRIWEVLRLAKSLGYRTFLISNGAALALPQFARRVLPWLDELCLSVHGHDAALHDSLTGRPGSFERLRRTFENVERHPGPLFVMANTVVVRANAAALSRILDFASGHSKLRHFLVSSLAPEGEGLRRYSSLAVRHREIVGRLPELAARAGRRGVVLRVFGVPVCALGPWKEHSNDLYFSPRATVGRAWLEDGSVGWFEEDGVLPTREREHPSFCSGCAWRRACGGVFRRYRREFGDDGLGPLEADA